MKKFTDFIFFGFISLLICSFMFFSVMLYLFIPKNTVYEEAGKNESYVPYYYSDTSTMPNTTIFFKVENCPIDFFINISAKSKNLSVNYTKKIFAEEKNIRHITFELAGFENTVNYLGGVEIETPFGLPCPAKNKKIIARDERLLVYGASLGEILTTETNPSTERKDYYCYVLEELCLKFLSDCSPESYKFLKQNCETDISYTDFYDNYELLKNIKR